MIAAETNLLLPSDVYELVKSSSWFTSESYEVFIRLPSVANGNNNTSRVSKVLYYNAYPISQTAIDYHNADGQEEEPHGLICGYQRHTPGVQGSIPPKLKVNTRSNGGTNAPINQSACLSVDRTEHADSRPGQPSSLLVETTLSVELIRKFWLENFFIHQNHADISRCTNENDVLSLLTELYPELVGVSKKVLLRTFNRMTTEASINIRRFKSATRTLHHYNVTRKHGESSPIAATEVKFSLLNIRGMITENLNKSKFIRDSIVIPGASDHHVIMITESFLTPDHKDEEVTCFFPEFTIQRRDRDTAVGRKTERGDASLSRLLAFYPTK